MFMVVEEVAGLLVVLPDSITSSERLGSQILKNRVLEFSPYSVGSKKSILKLSLDLGG